MSTSLKLEITEGQIQNAIAVALADSFSPEKKDALIRDIVRAHMNFKENSYDKETLLSKIVGTIVRDIAKKTLESELENMNPEIEQIVREILGDRFKINILDSLKYQLNRIVLDNLKISVSLGV